MAARPLRKRGLTTAIILPPREGFSPEAVGAIGLLVHRLATGEDVVVGRRLAFPPFADRSFFPVPSISWPSAFWSPAQWMTGAGRYAASVARILRRLHPSRVEVHNRPEIALWLRRCFPEIDLALFLHNDPQAMRGARSPFERRALLARMQVVCVSHHLRARFLEGVGEDADVPVLPNCIDLSEIPPAFTRREQTILFAGRMVADKGADSFVAACAEVLPGLPGWQAEMIGADRFSRDSPQTPFLEALLPAAQAAGIVLRGHLPHRAVLEAMSRAAIVVVPSRWQEPFGMTALEALACGAPLIVSPRPGLLEVAGDAALIADPDEPGALARTLRHLVGDAALRARLGERGPVRAAGFDVQVARARLGLLRARKAAAAPAPLA